MGRASPASRPYVFRGPGWPLWFVGAAFIHNRRFGILFVAGLVAQVIGEAIV